jgi:mediator of RNA polymerase II transcription subunit 8
MGTSAAEPETGLSADQLAVLWRWAPIEANLEARRRNWGGDYTLEEIEMGAKNVVTGLRRKLNEESAEGSEEDEGEEEDEVGEEKESGPVSSQVAPPPLPLDDVFRFMMTGTAPKSL